MNIIEYKKISLFSATALSATAMIGSGWLFSAQLNAKLAGNYAFLAWFLAALLALSVGLCLSQVVAKYPVRGATTRSSALSHNNIFGMPFAFANWFGLMVTVATEAQATTQYLSAAINSETLINNHGLTVIAKLIALFILSIYLFINYFGIKFLAKVNNIITVLKIFVPLFTIGLFIIVKFDTSNFLLTSNNSFTASSVISAIVGAGLIYSYNGFQLSVAFASEVKNPRRNVPLSIIISIITVMVVYMLLQLAFMGVVPHSMLVNGWAALNFHSPLMNLAMLLGINFLALLLVTDSVISPSGTGYSYLGGCSRMFYAMAMEGQMPRWTITKLHEKYNLCQRSMLINFVMIGIVLWYSESWASLMVVVTGYHIIGYMAAPISMGAIRPKSRLIGMTVFTLLGIIMTTLPRYDLLMLNLSILALMFIYSIMQFIKNHKLINLMMLATPFVTYLWLIYFYQKITYVSIISILFYLSITSRKYVEFCKSHKTEPLNFTEGVEEIIADT